MLEESSIPVNNKTIKLSPEKINASKFSNNQNVAINENKAAMVY